MPISCILCIRVMQRTCNQSRFTSVTRNFMTCKSFVAHKCKEGGRCRRTKHILPPFLYPHAQLPSLSYTTLVVWAGITNYRLICPYKLECGGALLSRKTTPRHLGISKLFTKHLAKRLNSCWWWCRYWCLRRDPPPQPPPKFRRPDKLETISPL